MKKIVKTLMSLTVIIAMAFAFSTAAFAGDIHKNNNGKGMCKNTYETRTCGSYVGGTTFSHPFAPTGISCTFYRSTHYHTIKCSYCSHVFTTTKAIACIESHTSLANGGCGRYVKDCYKSYINSKITRDIIQNRIIFGSVLLLRNFKL